MHSLKHLLDIIDSIVKALLEPYTYITSNPGKEIRGQMIEAFNHWLKVPAEKLKVITRVVGMLHSASLLSVAISISFAVKNSSQPIR